MARIFGTDGVRGLANMAPMSPEVVMALGRAAVHVLALFFFRGQAVPDRWVRHTSI